MTSLTLFETGAALPATKSTILDGCYYREGMVTLTIIRASSPLGYIIIMELSLDIQSLPFTKKVKNVKYKLCSQCLCLM